ncbi:MAG TPA: hypothetical protein VFZ53_13435 [Polyangiaceae bacterium]
MTERTFASHAAGWLLAVALAGCSAAPENPGGGVDQGGSGGTAGTLGGSAGTIPGGTGGVGVRDPNDMRDLPTRKRTCDASGVNCTCLRLGLLGTLDSSADEKDTQPFVDWLNTNSGGSATVTMITTKPTLNAAFLEDYDILVVANVNGWTFSGAEKDAVHEWMLTTGGGMVTLTGFNSMPTEPAATSQLLERAGFSYTSMTAAAAQGELVPVYYKGGTTNLKQCLVWSGSEAFITTPVKFVPQTGGMEKLTLALDYVGAFIGWGVSAPAGATVVATDPVSGQPMAAALELEGKGRLLAFGDEWVIFRNQWEPVGTPSNQQMDMYNPCWLPDGAGGGRFHSVQTLYQTKQFWYDAVNYVAPPNECNFIINDPDVVVR